MQKTDNSTIFPVVAIGASAGGLEAISEFLTTIAPDLGMAYVIIQHLSPDHQSILPELLEKKTSMKVSQVTDGMPVERDRVYVIPPNSYMSIVDHKLLLSPRVRNDGFYHSIDHFLLALASVYKYKAIAVILSGTATDGTEGVRAIKAEGGITFAQDESARFTGMPANAAASGYVDFVLPPRKIAEELETLGRLPYTALLSPEEPVSPNEYELEKIHILLDKKWQVDFSNYKQATIVRRIFRRMALNKIRNLSEYIAILNESPEELDLLYKDLLINVTSFFRDPAIYEALSDEIFPPLFRDRETSNTIRIWIPACATGEEAYSVAICLFEYITDHSIFSPIQIFATDLSEGAIEKARAGIYSAVAMEQVQPQRVNRFFVRVEGHYQIIKSIRDICIFATHDLLKDPPFSKVDLISCQNVLIYLETRAQKRILHSFHYALKSSGFLLLGRSETIGNASEFFSQVGKEFKLFTKKETQNLHFNFYARSGISSSGSGPGEEKTAKRAMTPVDTEREIEKILLSRYVPGSVIVNKDMQILSFYGSAENYFQPGAGRASLHLLKMIREDLLLDVRTLVNQARKEGEPVKKEGIILSEGGKNLEVTIEVIPFRHSSKSPHFLVLFREERPFPGWSPQPGATTEDTGTDEKDRRIRRMEREIKNARDQMKLINEEFETNREELQSANEEILSSNEELQSINEELETSKEELQSTNEELTTINEELIHRNNDLKEAMEYSDAIIHTMTQPLVVLVGDMRVRMANKAFYDFSRLNPGSAEGNHFFAIAEGQWNIASLKEKMNEIVSENISFENFRIAHIFPGIGLRILLLNAMRISPDVNKNNRYLLTIQDITDRENTIIELDKAKEYFHLLVQNAFDIITIYSEDGIIKYQSESLERILGFRPEERIGKNAFIQGLIHPEDLHLKKEMFRRSLESPDENITQEYRLRHKDGTYRSIEAVCKNLLHNPYIGGFVVNYRDVTNQKLLERQREEFIGIASHELKTPVTSIKGYTQIIREYLVSEDDTEMGLYIERLNKQVDRLSHLITNLLDVTKITGGHLQLQNTVFDMNELVGQITDEMQGMTSMNIVTDLKAQRQTWGDKERIGQVLTNLVSNAIKYSANSKDIIVRTWSDEQNITVSVKDLGIGITEKEREIIFERFFRVRDKETNTIPGIGLGLYISAQIVKRHSGDIWVNSKKGEGSEFCFTIPLNNQ